MWVRGVYSGLPLGWRYDSCCFSSVDRLRLLRETLRRESSEPEGDVLLRFAGGSLSMAVVASL